MSNATTKGQNHNQHSSMSFIKSKLKESPLTLPGYHDVLESSQLPGVNRIMDKTVGKARRFIWAAVLIGFVLIFLIHFGFITAQYIEKPLNQETKFNSAPFDFPDVTLCHTGPFSWSRSRSAKDVTIGNHTFPLARDITFGFKNFWKSLLPEFADLPLNKYTRDDNQIARQTLLTIAKEGGFGHQRQETVLDCSYAGQPCSFLNFTTVFLPRDIACFTFRVPETNSRMSGPESGLSLVLMDKDRLNVMTNLETLDFIRGIRIYIHPRGTWPHGGEVTLAQVGTSTAITLDMTKRVALNLDRVPCLDNPSTIKLCISRLNELPCSDFKYSIPACVLAGLQRRIVNKCACLSEELPLPADVYEKGLPPCHEVDLRAVVANYEPGNSTRADYLASLVPESILNETKQRHECLKLTRINADEKEIQEECLPLCERDTYSIHTSNFVWPTDARYAYKPLQRYGEHILNLTRNTDTNTVIVKKYLIDNKNLQNTEYVREAFVRLKIFAKTPTAVLVKESLAYPITSYLSDFGGIIGLWIGFSVITLVEVIESYLALCCKRKKIRATADSANA